MQENQYVAAVAFFSVLAVVRGFFRVIILHTILHLILSPTEAIAAAFPPRGFLYCSSSYAPNHVKTSPPQALSMWQYALNVQVLMHGPAMASV